jgi:Dictyostelium (slime mold) repeat
MTHEIVSGKAVYQVLLLLSLRFATTYGQLDINCSVRNPCQVCDARDCDLDAQCAGPDLLCADQHKPALTALGYDPRKANCGNYVGTRTSEVCFLKTLLASLPQCTSNEDCDDRNICNGVEVCDPHGKYCIPGKPLCSDGNLCTTDACDPVTGGCTFTPITCPQTGQRCDTYDGRCKSPFYKACDFLGLRRSSCNRTTTFVGFTNQTRIPTEIGLLTELSWLGLRDNRMVGRISAQIGNMFKLHTLNLHGNFLKGTVPTQLAQLSRLLSLTLYGNRLTGSIPPTMCAPNRVIAIDCGEVACSCCVDRNGTACP